MADFFTSSYAQTVSNTGATVAKLGDNALKTVGPDGYTAASLGGARTYAGPFTRFGTRELQFLEIAAVEDNSAVDFTKAVLAGTGSYTDSGSLMTKAIQALQQFGEVYTVGTPSATEFTVILAKDTLNGAEAASNVDAETYGAMEAAIDAAIGIGTGTHSVTVTPLTLTGDDLV
jgi:hypothetical protein